jgi:4-nitrophenyl phosphatase
LIGLQFRGFVFDIDGCLMRGANPIPGAAEAVAELKARGMRVRYFTNDSAKTPDELAARLRRGGVDVEAVEVLTSGLVAAEYVAGKHAGGVLAVGGAALREALEARGLNLVDDRSAEVVVVGRDVDFNYEKLDAACQVIWAGGIFLATNLDRRVPVDTGFVPGTGAIVSSVAWATDRRPRVMGKPSIWAGRAAVRSLGVPAAEIVFVGDQLQQDVRMGKNVGAAGVLVLTGSSRREDVQRVAARYRPDAVLADVAALPGWLDADQSHKEVDALNEDRRLTGVCSPGRRPGPSRRLDRIGGV